MNATEKMDAHTLELLEFHKVRELLATYAACSLGKDLARLAEPHRDVDRIREELALVTEMVGWATGGPQHYSGRSMEEMHKHLLITPQEWQAFLDDFQQTLDTFNVPPVEQAELFAIIESTRAAIVIAPLQENRDASA